MAQNDWDKAKFQHPFTAIIAGPTSSGKTILTRDIIANYKLTIAINKKPKVLWCYGQMQDVYKKPVPGITTKYHHGLVSQNQLTTIKPDIIVIDDLMSEIANEISLANLFTKHSHHMNISVIFIVQNLFYQSKQMRTISLNAHYFILLKNPRDRLQVQNLGRQIMPGETNYFMDVYNHATREPYSHLIVDVSATCPDHLRLRVWKKDVKGFLVYKQEK